MEQTQGKDLARKNTLFFVVSKFTHASSIQWSTQEIPLLYCISSISRLSQKGLILDQLSPSPGGVSSTDCTSPGWTKGPRRSKMDRSITTQTQEFWHGRRKDKGFYASLVMLQERSQVLCKFYRKKSLDISFLTVPKLPSRYLLPFYYIFCDSVGYR